MSAEQVYQYYRHNPDLTYRPTGFDIVGSADIPWIQYVHRVGGYFGSEEIEKELQELTFDGGNVSLGESINNDIVVFGYSEPAPKKKLLKKTNTHTTQYKKLKKDIKPAPKFSNISDEILYKCLSSDSNDSNENNGSNEISEGTFLDLIETDTTEYYEEGEIAIPDVDGNESGSSDDEIDSVSRDDNIASDSGDESPIGENTNNIITGSDNDITGLFM